MVVVEEFVEELIVFWDLVDFGVFSFVRAQGSQIAGRSEQPISAQSSWLCMTT